MCRFAKGVLGMYRVEWIDDEGFMRIRDGFMTSEEAHDWIKKRHFNPVFNCPMVFDDGE